MRWKSADFMEAENIFIFQANLLPVLSTNMHFLLPLREREGGNPNQWKSTVAKFHPSPRPSFPKMQKCCLSVIRPHSIEIQFFSIQDRTVGQPSLVHKSFAHIRQPTDLHSLAGGKLC